MPDTARQIRNEFKTSVESSIKKTERSADTLHNKTIHDKGEADAAKREILETLSEMRRAMNSAFDRIESKVNAAVPTMSGEQQRELKNAIQDIGGYVKKFTNIIEDVCNKVIAYFERALDRIRDSLRDLKQTIKDCCDTIRKAFSDW